MEQAMPRTGRHSGWSEKENQMLWETADEAQQQGLPLKAVFERVAEQTGRRPNSIRNYYYAQVRQREDADRHPARFVPFAPEEVDWLMEQVLIARAAGQSVRSCLQKLSGGDHSLMLRYQNKYRAVVKSRPDYVRGIVARLNDQGVACDTPTVNHRAHTDVAAACDSLNQEARRSGEPELVRACETLVRCLRDRREPEMELKNAVEALIGPIKAFVACPKSERIENLDAFCGEMIEKVGALETKIPVSSNRIE